MHLSCLNDEISRHSSGSEEGSEQPHSKAQNTGASVASSMTTLWSDAVAEIIVQDITIGARPECLVSIVSNLRQSTARNDVPHTAIRACQWGS
jgi:hypothetical protein